MKENQGVGQYAPTGWRFRIGLIFFVIAWICPLFIPFVTNTNLTTEAKTFLSGFLLIGAPEIFSVISIVILGKSGFNYIKTKAFSFIKRAAPQGEVSRTRYRIGLFMLLLHVVNAQFIFYAPDLIIGYSENRIAMNLVAEFLFIVTLFVLGRDFWEKLRALFLYDVKAQMPNRV
jgi:hypothetical protein